MLIVLKYGRKVQPSDLLIMMLKMKNAQVNTLDNMKLDVLMTLKNRVEILILTVQ